MTYTKLNEYERKIAILEAKVYAYEAIIKNSNFAMAVISNEDKEEPKEASKDETNN